MIVTVVSMPEVSVTRTDAAEARHRLATDPFVLVDVELPVEDQEGERSVADQLGLDTESLDWFGRADEPPRAEYLGDRSYFVVPVVHEERDRSHPRGGDRALHGHRAPGPGGPGEDPARGRLGLLGPLLGTGPVGLAAKQDEGLTQGVAQVPCGSGRNPGERRVGEDPPHPLRPHLARSAATAGGGGGDAVHPIGGRLPAAARTADNARARSRCLTRRLTPDARVRMRVGVVAAQDPEHAHIYFHTTLTSAGTARRREPCHIRGACLHRAAGGHHGVRRHQRGQAPLGCTGHQQPGGVRLLAPGRRHTSSGRRKPDVEADTGGLPAGGRRLRQ